MPTQNTGTDSTTVTVEAGPVASAAPTDTLICTGDSVPLAAQGTGGLPPYSFAWTPAEGLSNPNSATPIATPTSSTTYTVTVTDLAGCAGIASVTITVGENVIADAGPDVEIAMGTPVPIGGSPTASGGTEPYAYSWTPTAGLDDPTVANPIASPADTTTYVVFVTDAAGCTAFDSTTVRILFELEAHAGPDVTLCGGDSVAIGGNPTANGRHSALHVQLDPDRGPGRSDGCQPARESGRDDNLHRDRDG